MNCGSSQAPLSANRMEALMPTCQKILEYSCVKPAYFRLKNRCSHSWTVMMLSFLLFVAMMSAGNTKEKTAKSPLPAGFSYLRNIAPDILQDMRYASGNNFTGSILPGYNASECILRSEVAHALYQVQKSLKSKGYSLKVYDCYRPARTVRAFVVWAHDQKKSSNKDYYPRLAKSSLFAKGYIARHSSHSTGSSVDLTLVRLPARSQPDYDPAISRNPCIAPYDKRPDDNSIDMGTGYDCFDVMSHTAHPAITGPARANRQLLRSAMTPLGFVNYRKEWWHYSYKKSSIPRIYHDFPIMPRHSMKRHGTRRRDTK